MISSRSQKDRRNANRSIVISACNLVWKLERRVTRPIAATKLCVPQRCVHLSTRCKKMPREKNGERTFTREVAANSLCRLDKSFMRKLWRRFPEDARWRHRTSGKIIRTAYSFERIIDRGLWRDIEEKSIFTLIVKHDSAQRDNLRLRAGQVGKTCVHPATVARGCTLLRVSDNTNQNNHCIIYCNIAFCFKTL